MLGASPRCRRSSATVRKVATTEAPVLVVGESGTGKELVAQAIHRLSARKEEAFIVINCGAIPETLLESELFGHEKGAFTGAHIQRKGRIEAAQGGTLFLDEIGELSLGLQVKASSLSAGAGHRADRRKGTDPGGCPSHHRHEPRLETGDEEPGFSGRTSIFGSR